MKIALLFVLSLLLQAQEPKTANEWYDHIQKLRAEANKLWREPNNTPDQLREAARKHHEMLAILHDPKLTEFRKESFILRVKDQDIYADLVLIYVRLGEIAKAKENLKALQAFGKDPVNAEGRNPGFSVMYLRNHEYINDLEDKYPEFHRMMLDLRRLDPLWDIMYTKVPFSLEYREKLPLEERLAGFSTLWSEIKYNFAFFDNSDVEWNESYRTYLPEVMAGESTYDYYRVLQKMVAELNDGHTNVYFPRDLYAQKLSGQPPIRTEAIGGKVYVRRIDSSTLAQMGVEVGDEIISVDGKDVHAYVKSEIEPYTSIATPQDGLVRLYDYLLLDGPPDKTVSLRVRKANGDLKTYGLRRIASANAPVVVPYEFKMIGNTAVVRINDFENEGHISKFIADFKAHPEVKALIFDVRDNGGGNSDYAAQIIAGLIDAPVKMTASEIRLYNPLYRVGRTPLRLRKLSAADEILPTDKWKFRGPVALLIGPRTFSAAEDFVSMFVGAKQGPIIGEATAGSTGQPIFISLPGGGSARICVKRDYLPDGSPFVGVGIRPTIEVSHSAEDLRKGRDPALERALKEVNTTL